MAVADSLERLPWIDKERMGAMGWSYGGYMMMWLEGHTTRFKAIVSMMGLYDLTAFHGATEELWFPEWDLGGRPWTSEYYNAHLDWFHTYLGGDPAPYDNMKMIQNQAFIKE